jgi:uncharacterized protein (DUF58 family)
VKRWLQWLFPVRSRRIEISTGGRWFLLFTLLLGVAAINSGNNVIYLIESLLLSSLLFSGILSEITVNRARLRRISGQAVAGEHTRDILLLENRSWFPLYCVEAGEWRAGGKWEALGFALIVLPRSEARLLSGQVFPERGRFEWEGLAVATSFPFGFARKIRILGGGGSRICWPPPSPGGGVGGGQGEWEWEPGELEEVEPGEDVSRLHWPTTVRTGRPMARSRRRQSAEEEEVEIDLDGPDEREELIRWAAGRLLGKARRLKIRKHGRVQVIEGARPALDTLALLPKEGI